MSTSYISSLFARGAGKGNAANEVGASQRGADEGRALPEGRGEAGLIDLRGCGPKKLAGRRMWKPALVASALGITEDELWERLK